MNEEMLTTGRDAYLIGIPLILLLLFGLFRLDELVSRPKKTLKRRRPSCHVDEDGEPVLSDPDGRLSSTHSAAGNQIGSGRQRGLDPAPAKPSRKAQKPAR
jgi:hypothetical protein